MSGTENNPNTQTPEPSLRDIGQSIRDLSDSLKSFVDSFSQPQSQERQRGSQDPRPQQRLRRVSEALREDLANRQLLDELDTNSDEERSRDTNNFATNPLADGRNTSSRTNRQVQQRQAQQQIVVMQAPKPGPYYTDENPEEWLKEFKRIMDKLGKKEDEFLSEIPILLKGSARRWFNDNEQDFRNKYSRFETKFIERFHKDPIVYQTKLKTMKQKPNQDLEEYLTSLNKIAKPGRLSEQEIKMAFIEGIRDNETRRYARQTYFFQVANQKTDLDRILFSLQEFENDGRAKTYSNFKSLNDSSNKGAQLKDNKGSIKFKKDFKGKKVNMVGEEQKEEEEKDNLVNEEVQSENSKSDQEEQREANFISLSKPKKRAQGKNIVKNFVRNLFRNIIEKREVLDSNEPIGLSYFIEEYEQKAINKYLKTKLKNKIKSLELNRKTQYALRQCLTKRKIRKWVQKVPICTKQQQPSEEICKVTGWEESPIFSTYERFSNRQLKKIRASLFRKENPPIIQLEKLAHKLKEQEQRAKWLKSKHRRKIVKTLVQEIFHNLLSWRPTSEKEGKIGLNEECFVGMIEGTSRSPISQIQYFEHIYLRVISGFPLSNQGNSHLLMIFDEKGNLLQSGGIQQKVRYHIIDYLDRHFLPNKIIRTIKTTDEKWFYGSFTTYLAEKDIYHDRQFLRVDEIDRRVHQIYRKMPINLNWDTYTIQLQGYDSPIIFTIEEDEQVNSISGSLHKQLVQKVKSAKYIPAKTAKQFAENTLSNMSLGQVLESSPIVRNDWKTYIDDCESQYQDNLNNSKKQRVDKNKETQNSQEVNSISIPVATNVPFDYVLCKVCGKLAYGMIDTGANISVIAQNFIQRNQLQNLVDDTDESIKVANGKSVGAQGIIQKSKAKFQFVDSWDIPVDLLVTDSNSYDIIIGRNIQRTLSIEILPNGIRYKDPILKNMQEIEYSNYRAVNYILKENFQVLISESQETKTPEYVALYPNFPKTKKYQVIIMDPPWKYDTHSVPSLAPPYKTLSLAQLKMLPINEVCEQNSVLLMWTTGPMVEQAMELIRSYGFQYKTILFSWLKLNAQGKPYEGKGNYTQPCVEILLIGTRGKAKRIMKENAQVSQFVEAQIFKHSQKPKQIFDEIAKLFLIRETKNLEVFSRQQQPHFDAYGNEIKEYFQENKDRYNKQTKIDFKQVNNIERCDSNNFEEVIEDFDEITQNSTQQQSISAEVLMTETLPTEENDTNKQISEMPLGCFPKLKVKVKQVIKKFRNIFASTLSELKRTKVFRHEIHLKPDAKPVQQNPYRMAKIEIEFVKKETQELLKLGLIREGVSEWASPLVIVKKANGKLRMCVDYRKLNAATIDEKFPIPRIDDIFAQLQGALIFSKLDLKSGFWQIPIAREHQHLTAFITPDGQYIWECMPFGLKNAPSTFQRTMSKVLQEAIRDFVMVYIDDVIIYSKTEEQHLEHLQWVFKRLQQENLKLGPDKCELFKKKINILGHTIEENKISPMIEKVEAIQQIESPKSKTQIRSFLGLTGYYRQFIPNFSKIAQPLYKITGEKSNWEWGNEQELAFQKLKVALMENPVLNLCVDDKPFILYTDFSVLGVGAVLTQQLSQRKEMVIEFASRTLTAYERNLDAYQGEILAVYWALNRFRHYLLGQKFTLVTDNKALEWVLKLNNPSRKINRWLIEILEYNFDIKHRKGTTHNNADALSRLLPKQSESKEVHIVQTLEQVACKGCKNSERKHIGIQDILIICNLCGDLWHTKCYTPQIQAEPNMIWYCKQCIKEVQKLQNKDITLDFLVHKYLKTSILPNDIEQVEKARIIKRASKYSLQDNRIFYRSKYGLKLVPTIIERQQLIKECHTMGGHQAVEKTMQLIQQTYAWHNLFKDVVNYILNCTTCNATNPKFAIKEEYYPTEKGQKPFQLMSMDLITGLPKTKRGNMHIVIAVDTFSKFVEMRPLANKSSILVGKFVLEDIVCRHGCPEKIRTDKGKEFLGNLSVILQQYGIQHKTISQGYPEANSQSERIIQTTERILRRFLIDNPNNLQWDDIVPFVARSLRISTSRSTKLSPYEILYGYPMRLPSTIEHNNITQQDLSDLEIKAYTRGLIQHLTKLHKKTEQQLRFEDENQAKKHQRLKNGGKINFIPGQLVYLRSMRFNKTQPPVTGPYQFIKIIGKKGEVEIMDVTTGKLRTQNIAQLAPLQMLPEFNEVQTPHQFALINNLISCNSQQQQQQIKNKMSLSKVSKYKEYYNQAKADSLVILPTNYKFAYENISKEEQLYMNSQKHTFKQWEEKFKENKYDSATQVCERFKIRCIYVSWDIPEEPVILIPTEKDLQSMATVSVQNDQVVDPKNVRVSIFRNAQNGMFVNKAIIICMEISETALVYKNLEKRLYRLSFFNPVLQAIGLPSIEQKLIELDELQSNYELELYKIHPSFLCADKHPLGKQHVLFLDKLVFKYETQSGVPSQDILGFKNPELPKFVQFNMTLGEYVAGTLDQTAQDYYQSCKEKFNTEITNFKIARKYKNSQILKYENPNKSLELIKAEKQILEQTFEGRLLLNKRPWSSNGYTRKPPIAEKDYLTIIRNSKKISLPHELAEHFYPSENQPHSNLKINTLEEKQKVKDFEEKKGSYNENLKNFKKTELPIPNTKPNFNKNFFDKQKTQGKFIFGQRKYAHFLHTKKQIENEQIEEQQRAQQREQDNLQASELFENSPKAEKHELSQETQSEQSEILHNEFELSEKDFEQSSETTQLSSKQPQFQGPGKQVNQDQAELTNASPSNNLAEDNLNFNQILIEQNNQLLAKVSNLEEQVKNLNSEFQAFKKIKITFE